MNTDWTSALRPPEWTARAACAGRVDDDTWFPTVERHDGRAVRRARAICRGCPVQAECIQFAIETDSRFGVWAGRTGRERPNNLRTA